MPAPPKLDEECFFIAPIGKEGSEERYRSDGVLEYIVAPAASEVGLQAVRADKLAEPGQITVQVIEHILGARAAVADLTLRNPNVYYELAVRHTARLPTVLIAEQSEQLPFDIAQMRTIFFSHTDLASAARCRTEIVHQLREALDGAVDSPIATTVDLQRLQAGNTVERNVAELITGVADLSKTVTEMRRQLSLQGTSPLTADLIHAMRQVGKELTDFSEAAQKTPELLPLLKRLRKAFIEMASQLVPERQLLTNRQLLLNRVTQDTAHESRSVYIQQDDFGLLEDAIRESGPEKE
jgi:hypothetical protein